MRELSQYTLIEPFHIGRTYVVYRGLRNHDRSPVLVKMCKSEHPSERDTARLRHEYLIACELHAPCIPHAYALERAGQGFALILEDFGGRPLDELVGLARCDLQTALQIAIALAESVGILHEHRVIHKDLKPPSILFNPETRAVQLTDFGIATRLSQETRQAARPDALEGTLAYMSPEQTGRMNHTLDYRTDFYSLGVTLYELFAGTPPFLATDPMELVHSHIARTPEPLHERAQDMPEALSAIVMKLLAKAAEDRYQSTYGLRADLETCQRQLTQTGTIVGFPLGTRDVPAAIRIVQRIYGRETERQALHAALRRGAGAAS